MVVHYNSEAPTTGWVCAEYDTACGVYSYEFDRVVSSGWTHVTCKRCLRHKRRKERFKRAVVALRGGTTRLGRTPKGCVCPEVETKRRDE